MKMKLLRLTPLVFLTFSPLLAHAQVTFTGDGLTGNVDYFFADGNWSSGALPLNDPQDIVAQSSFMLDGERLSFPCKSLTMEPGVNGFIARGELLIEGDLSLLGGTLEVQRQALLKWSGTATIGGSRQSRLSLVGGLRDEIDPRVQGGSLSVESGSMLFFRWLQKLPGGLPGNSTALITLSDTLTFGGDNRLGFAMDEFLDPSTELLPGDYLLISAQKIEGPIPELDAANLDDSITSRMTVVAAEDGKGIVLRVAAP